MAIWTPLDMLALNPSFDGWVLPLAGMAGLASSPAEPAVAGFGPLGWSRASVFQDAPSPRPFGRLVSSKAGPFSRLRKVASGLARVNQRLDENRLYFKHLQRPIP